MILLAEIQLKCADGKVSRMPGENLRTFLISQLSGVLKGCSVRNIHQLCDFYERARYSPENFTSGHLSEYRELVANLVQV